MTAPRLLSINALIRLASAGSGQLFAFLLASRMAANASQGALLVGVIGAAFFLTELIGAPLAGRAADRLGQGRVLRWGPIFGVLSALVAASAALGAGSIPLLVVILLIARLNEGASAACAVPTTLTLLSRATDGDPIRRTRLMGLFEITSLVGMIAGYVIMGVAWDRMETYSFLLLPPFYALAWVLVGSPGPEDRPMLARVVDPARASIRTTLRALAARRGSVAFGISWLAVNAVVGVWIQQAPFLLRLPERSSTQALVGGFSGAQIGMIFTVWGAAFLSGIGLWSLLVPGWPRRRAMSIALVGMVGVVASLAWLNHGGPRFVLAIVILMVLIEAGFRKLAFLEGDMKAWRRRSLPMAKGNAVDSDG